MPGSCQYQTTASERYQNPALGATCGAPTFHAVDVPEKQRVDAPDGSVQFQETGRMLARETPDAHCPAHGGVPDPNNPAPAPAAGDVAGLGDGLTQAFDLIRQHAGNLARTSGAVSSLEDRFRRVEAWIKEHDGPAAPVDAPPSSAAAAQDAPALAPWAAAAAGAAEAVSAPPTTEDAPGEISHGPRPGWGQAPVDEQNGGGEPA